MNNPRSGLVRRGMIQPPMTPPSPVTADAKQLHALIAERLQVRTAHKLGLSSIALAVHRHWQRETAAFIMIFGDDLNDPGPAGDPSLFGALTEALIIISECPTPKHV